jgi:glycogen phosphorylase
MPAKERIKVNPRVVLFAGKAAPGYWMAKLLIRLIVNVGKVINADPDVKGVLTVLFLPDYSVSCMSAYFSIGFCCFSDIFFTYLPWLSF